MSRLSSDSLFEGVAEGLVLCRQTTSEVLEVNDRFCRLAGLDAASLEGVPLSEFGYRATESETELRTAIETASGDVFEWTIQDRQGNPVPLALSVSEIRDDGDVYALVSARSKTDDGNRWGISAHRRRLEGAMTAGGVAWWELDVESGAVLFHEEKAVALGYSPERFDHYTDFTDLVHPEDREQVMAAMDAHLEGDAERYDTEYRIETSSGGYRWFHDVGCVTDRAADGSPAKVTGIVVDITDRKRLEQRLVDQNDQLALLNRLIRHDIRNDMTVALGWLETIREELPESYQSDFDRVTRACRHTVELTTLSRDLMTVIIEDEDGLESGPVDLRSIVLMEVEKAQELFEHANITIPGEIPSVTVEANVMLSSVLSNLLNNAVQHNDKETPQVTLGVELEDETVHLQIADNGPGIAGENRETIFGRGEKGLDSEGTGMGLYLVDTLLDVYGGRVRVEDNEPTGSVFVVELPRSDG